MWKNSCKFAVQFNRMRSNDGEFNLLARFHTVWEEKIADPVQSEMVDY